MYRIYILLLPVMIFSAVACSTTSQTARPPVEAQEGGPQDNNAAPAWFSKESIAYNDTTVHAYAAAIGGDSASAESKAVSRAAALLRQSISERLETVRTGAAEELGKGSGLSEPGFLIDYRKATNALDDIVITQQTSAEAVEGQHSFRGFAEVRAGRAELIERLGEQLSSYEETWDILLNSAAFKEF